MSFLSTDTAANYRAVCRSGELVFDSIDLTIPEYGGWKARVCFKEENLDLASSGTLTFRDLSLNYFKISGGKYFNDGEYTIYGRDLSVKCVPKSWVSVNIITVLRHILGDIPFSVDSLLSTYVLSNFSIIGSLRLGSALGILCQYVGTRWYVDLSGAIVIGNRQLREQPTKYILLDRDPRRNTLDIHLEDGIVIPGTVIEDVTAKDVQYCLSDNRDTVTIYY